VKFKKAEKKILVNYEIELDHGINVVGADNPVEDFNFVKVFILLSILRVPYI